MQLITLVSELDDLRAKQSITTGFVPTMGALHSGHLSLITESKRRNEQTICSVFVNPTQFNDPKDFSRYPRQLDADSKLLEEAGCSVLFAPSIMEIYPKPDTEVYSFGQLTSVLEGEHRPGHFQGVASVVRRLLLLTKPDRAYFGLKDYQQYLVVKQLVQNFYIPTEIIGFPTVREKNGLAKSSRNVLLSADGFEKASVIYNALNWVRQNYSLGQVAKLNKEASKLIASKGLEVEYFEIVDAYTLAPLNQASQSPIALVAAKLEGVRLIDNLPLA